MANLKQTSVTNTKLPDQLLSTDYLVIAGGGGSGKSDSGGNTSGGGGAGGYLELTSQNIVLGTAQTITVGAGGAGGTSPTTNGSNGDDSVLN